MRSRIGWAAAAAAVALVGAIPALWGRPSPDVAWFFYLADRMLQGERLYRDVVEVNPPLIVWLNLPVAALARAAAVPAEMVYGAALLVLIGVSLALAARLLPEEEPWRAPGVRPVALLLGLVVLLPLAGEDFGEREHLLLILTLPYTLLVIARAGGRSPGRGLALAVGVMAGVGFTLKPYFVPLWLALEAYLVRARPAPPWRRPETVAVVGVGLLYGAAVLLFTPEYFDLARTFGGLYWSYLRGPLWLTAFLGEGSALPLLALLAFAVLYRRDPGGHVWRVFAIAVGAAVLSALLQGKGWRYHFYPAMGYGLLLLAAMGWGARRPLERMAQQLYAAACVAAVFTAVALTLLQSGYPQHSATSPSLRRGSGLLGAEPRAPPAGAGRQCAGAVEQHGVGVSAGHQHRARGGRRDFRVSGCCPALYMSELRADAPIRFRNGSAMSAQERYLGEAVVEDMERRPPEVLVELRPGPDQRKRSGSGGSTTWNTSDETLGFASWLARYGFAGDVGEYRLYRRGAVAAAVPDETDPTASGTLAAGWDGTRGIQLDREGLLGAVLLIPTWLVALRRERGAPTGPVSTPRV